MTNITIDIQPHNKHVIIKDDHGNKCAYVGYNRKTALSRFKHEFGHHGAHGLEIVDISN